MQRTRYPLFFCLVSKVPNGVKKLYLTFDASLVEEKVMFVMSTPELALKVTKYLHTEYNKVLFPCAGTGEFLKHIKCNFSHANDIDFAFNEVLLTLADKVTHYDTAHLPRTEKYDLVIDNLPIFLFDEQRGYIYESIIRDCVEFVAKHGTMCVSVNPMYETNWWLHSYLLGKFETIEIKTFEAEFEPVTFLYCYNRIG